MKKRNSLKEVSKAEIRTALQEVCNRTFGCGLEEATEKQAFKTVCSYVREELAEKRRAFQKEIREKEQKQVYYMSMEFLVGTSLRNNLYNMGILDSVTDVMKELGFSVERLCAMEPDAGLGNGGLGRLASCYMDSLTGCD